MATYSEALRVLQPLIEPVYSALEEGLKASMKHHGAWKLRREDDQNYFTHAARRVACDTLISKGIQATHDSGRPYLRMSGLLIPYKHMAVKVLRPQVNAAGEMIIPLPKSRRMQSFYRQDDGSALPGLETDNVLLLWRDNAGVLLDPMLLVRPLGGDHRRDSLRLDWEGPLARGMANLRAADLDELEPTREYRQLGDEEAG